MVARAEPSTMRMASSKWAARAKKKVKEGVDCEQKVGRKASSVRASACQCVPVRASACQCVQCVQCAPLRSVAKHPHRGSNPQTLEMPTYH